MSKPSIPLQMSGSLRDVPVADLARLLQSARLTGCLQLHSETCPGSLYFVRGEMVEAVAYRNFGVNALKVISLMCRGRFEFKPTFEMRSETLSIFSTEELIRYLEHQMEMARQLQEFAPTSHEIPRFTEGTTPEGFEFTQEEIALALYTTEGEKTIRTLAIEMGLTELQVSFTVARFRVAGLMEMTKPDLNSPSLQEVSQVATSNKTPQERVAVS